MKALILFFLSLLSFSVLANNALAVYERSFVDKNTGVYESGSDVFFVVKQACLTTKKYAGTQESKAAEKEFYRLLLLEITKRNVSFSNNIAGISEPLRADVTKLISKKYSVNSAISHQLIFDRNTQKNSCIQEYVVSISANQFKPNGVNIPSKEVEATVFELLSSALENENYVLVSQYLNSLNLKQLATIYALFSNEDAIAINLRVTDELTKCQTGNCTLAKKEHSEFDVNHVLSTAFLYEGLVKIINNHPSKELANTLYKQAEFNFKKGQNPERIVQDLTLSLNLNPNDLNSWKMLANIYRALGDHGKEYAAATQYIINNPDDLEPWVYFYLAQKRMNPELATELQRWLLVFTSHTEISSWAKKQIGN